MILFKMTALASLLALSAPVSAQVEQVIDGGAVETVPGTHSSPWNIGNSIIIGQYSSGTLKIADGGRVSNTQGYIGDNASGTGLVTVDGTGSTWANSSSLYVGYSGTGTLNIQNGGVVSNTTGYIGHNSDAIGTVAVTGAGATWINSQSLGVGVSGRGELTISNGGTVSNTEGYIGAAISGSGIVRVDGIGSTWTNSMTLYVGDWGNGELIISKGGAVSNAVGRIGYRAGSSGSVTVDGSSSTWTNNGNLFIGNYGTGELTISNGGLVSANAVGLALYSRGTATINIGAAEGMAAVAAGTLDAPFVVFGEGSGAIVFNHTNTNYVFSAEITSNDDSPATAGTVKVLSGTTIMTGTSSYFGDTLVEDGSLRAGEADVFSHASAFMVNSSATLDLDGYNQSVAGLANSGIVHIGSSTSANPVGTTLNINGNYESNGGSLYLRATLGDDASPTDKLIASSVSTGPDGATRLYVSNIGGVGDTTTEGIQVVQVATTSSSNAFVLGAPVTAGIYEYVLNQSTNQSWYLSNNVIYPLQPEESTTWQYIYNPNIGSYLGNQYAAATMFNQNILDRRDSTRSPDQTIWMRSNYNRAQSDILNGKQEVTIKTGLLQIGADLIEQDNLVAGVYAGYGHSDIDNKSRQTGTSADGKVNGYQVGVYGSWLPDNNAGLFADVWAYYAWYDNKLSGAAQYSTTKYDSTGYALSGEIGYGFELSQQWILEPHAQLIYTHIDADDFYDSHGTWYSSNKGSGIQTRLGARLYGQNAPGQHGVNPFIEANWLHNNLDNGVSLNRYQTSSDVGKNVGEVKIGVQGQVTDRLSVWGHVGAQRGSNSFKRYALQFGLGWLW